MSAVKGPLTNEVKLRCFPGYQCDLDEWDPWLQWEEWASVALKQTRLWVQSNMVWDFVIAEMTISFNGTDSYSEFVC